MRKWDPMVLANDPKACLFQVEMCLSGNDYKEHLEELTELARVISYPTETVVPVVTDLQYKYGITKRGPVAENFMNMVLRASSPNIDERISDGAGVYEERMGITGADAFDGWPQSENKIRKERVSEVVLTIATRKSFADNYHKFDTMGIEDRVNKLKPDQSWIILIIDGHDGPFVTAKSTLKMIRTLVEGSTSERLMATVNEVSSLNSDLLIFTDSSKAIECLVRQGLIEVVVLGDNLVSYPIGGEVSRDLYTESEARQRIDEIFKDEEPTNLSDLNGLKRWINGENGPQAKHKDFLNSIYLSILEERGSEHDGRSYGMVADIKENLALALNNGLSENSIRMCAGYINSFVLKRPEAISSTLSYTSPIESRKMDANSPVASFRGATRDNANYRDLTSVFYDRSAPRYSKSEDLRRWIVAGKYLEADVKKMEELIPQLITVGMSARFDRQEDRDIAVEQIRAKLVEADDLGVDMELIVEVSRYLNYKAGMTPEPTVKMRLNMGAQDL